MTAPIWEALELLLVGMTTVALVLGLVVLAGRLLIFLVNQTTPAAPRKTRNNSSASLTSTDIDPAIVAVITAAVEIQTAGQGEIQKINPL